MSLSNPLPSTAMHPICCFSQATRASFIPITRGGVAGGHKQGTHSGQSGDGPPSKDTEFPLEGQQFHLNLSGWYWRPRLWGLAKHVTRLGLLLFDIIGEARVTAPLYR